MPTTITQPETAIKHEVVANNYVWQDLHISAVTNRIQLFGRCLMLGDRGTGKSDVVGHLLRQDALGENVYLIDGNRDGSSPEELEAARLGLELVYDRYKAGVVETELAVIVDHAPNLLNTGENEALNERRKELIGDLTNLIREEIPVLVISDHKPDEDNEAPEMAEFAAEFGPAQTYNYEANQKDVYGEEDRAIEEAAMEAAMYPKMRELADKLHLSMPEVERLRKQGGNGYIVQALRFATKG